MGAILDISGAYPTVPAVRVGGGAAPVRPAFNGIPGIEDTVELSSLGRALADAAGESSLRLARIRAIREQIQNGNYVTPLRIDSTVSRMLDVLA